jgi:hypothetical protein
MIKNGNIAGLNGLNSSAYFRIMKKLGDLLVTNKNDVVDLLNESGVYASYGEDENSLVTKFVNNLPRNPKLMLNTSVFLESFNEASNFNGEIGDNIKKNYYTMRVYLGQEDMSNGDGEVGKKIGSFLSKATEGGGDSGGSGPVGSSTLQGAASGGVVGTIAGAVGDVAKLGTKISEGKQKKLYGAQDLAQKREESRNALLLASMQNRMSQEQGDKKKQEQEGKTKKTVIIIASVLGVLMLGLITYAIIKKK